VLFTATTFAFLYLPFVLAGYYLLGRRSPWAAAAWLCAASVFFYGYWMPAFTLLLLASIGANFAFGTRIGHATGPGGRDRARTPARAWLTAGIVFNLGLLGYFKYANFFVDNLNAMLGFEWKLARVILPIGISFYTFTQLAFLVDTWQGKVKEYRLVHYGLFVSYFPHLVAGPVLHHAQMMPQFANPAVYRFDGANFAAGVAIFALGLIKKVVLADGIAPYADAVFVPVDAGSAVAATEAWIGALAYTFQLYFDFSGYSDMAIGLSWMFNVRLPFNFDSPYRATSISEFWRRWHISLSTFLRDYLYVPLGGNRKGSVRRYLNLAITMVLGGLWHGAAWSFVLWGALHGAYLMFNHGLRAAAARLNWRAVPGARPVLGAIGWALTFVAVVVAWVFFRAETLPGALRVLQGMAGASATGVDPGLLLWNAGLKPEVGLGWCALLGLITLLPANSNRLGATLHDHLRARASWRTAAGAAALGLSALIVTLNAARDSVSAFIYFNF